MQIGGENMIVDSYVDTESSDYGFAVREVYVEAGKTYVFSAEGKVDDIGIANGKMCKIFLYPEDWSKEWTLEFTKNQFETKSIKFVAERSEKLFMTSYLYPNGGNRDGKAYAKWYQLQEGAKETKYQSAVKHVADAITKGSTDINGGLLATNLLQLKGVPIEAANVADVTSLTVVSTGHTHAYSMIKGSFSSTPQAPDVYLRNGVRYRITIGSAQLVDGDGSQFSLIIYDHVNDLTNDALYVVGNYSTSPQSWEFIVPDSGYWNLIAYAGKAGETAWNTVLYQGIKLQVVQLDPSVNTGLSGLLDNVAFWTGGDYLAALRETVATLLRKDGSGFFAGGLFNWDTIGNLNVGIFSVMQDRIVVHGDNGNIIITNKPIDAVKSNAGTYDLTGGVSRSYRKGTSIYVRDDSNDYMYLGGSDEIEVTEESLYNISLSINMNVALDMDSGFNTMYGMYDMGVSLYIYDGNELKYSEFIRYFNLDHEVEPSDYSYYNRDVMDTKIVNYVGSFKNSINVSLRARPFEIRTSASPSPNDYCNVNINTWIEGKAVSLYRETIIGNDGLYIRQDSSNEVKIWRKDNRVAMVINGLPTSDLDIATGGLYRSGNQLMIK